MNSYNGFTPNQRSKAGAWIRSQIAKGLRQRPTQCCACGQTEGVIDNHQEDYSEPYGDHLFLFPMCYACHMMLHCRFKAPGPWDAYRAQIRAGKVLKDAYHQRGFLRIKTQLLAGPCDELFVQRAVPPTRFPLDEIEAGLHLPRKSELF